MNGSILALRFLAMRSLKEMFSARLLPLAKALIKAEAEAHRCSESEVIELWAFQHARSPQAKALLAGHSETDALSSAVAEVLREHHKSGKSPSHSSGPAKYRLKTERAKPHKNGVS